MGNVFLDGTGVLAYVHKVYEHATPYFIMLHVSRVDTLDWQDALTIKHTDGRDIEGYESLDIFLVHKNREDNVILVDVGHVMDLKQLPTDIAIFRTMIHHGSPLSLRHRLKVLWFKLTDWL